MTAVVGRSIRLRWVHLLLGGALLMPYFLLTVVAVESADPTVAPFTSGSRQILAYLLCLPLVALTASFPLVRTLETTAAQALCGVPAALLAGSGSRSWAARGRTSAWFTLHLGLGALVSGLSLALPPAAVVLVLLPFFAELRGDRFNWPEAFDGPLRWTAPLIGLGLMVALWAAVACAGWLLARCAPALLGPLPADRLAAAEERAATLASRNRLARELHDSVGHALSAVTLQASAARRVIDHDPQFAREALAAIEETTRRTVDELDAVLGVLREEPPPHGPSGSPGDRPHPDRRAPVPGGPPLSELPRLLSSVRAAGTSVDLTGDTDPATLDALPSGPSREAYRIVQEGLSNALRHAGQVPIRLCLTRDDKELIIQMDNPTTGPRRPRQGGGRGLTGIAERALLLGGRATWEEREGNWRLTVHLPLEGGR